MIKGRLHLLPNVLSEGTADQVIPDAVKETALGLRYFIVENEKVSRRFLKSLDRSVDIDALQFSELEKHGKIIDYLGMLSPALEGHDIGLLSDAGCPAVADPGALVVAAAHENGIKVVPHVGPSSILMTVMASGMNGQAFTFNGYIPRDKKDRITAIKRMEDIAIKQGITQLFMDTPYRNAQVIEDILSACRPGTRLCIAADITGGKESIHTLSIEQWKKSKKWKMEKVPVMLALGV